MAFLDDFQDKSDWYRDHLFGTRCGLLNWAATRPKLAAGSESRKQLESLRALFADAHPSRAPLISARCNVIRAALQSDLNPEQIRQLVWEVVENYNEAWCYRSNTSLDLPTEYCRAVKEIEAVGGAENAAQMFCTPSEQFDPASPAVAFVAETWGIISGHEVVATRRNGNMRAGS